MKLKELMKSFVLAFLLLWVTLPINAQTVTTQQENQDSLVNVIAFFCKNDTLGYDYQHVKMKVVDNDTTVNYYYNCEFQLIVRDSTTQGYKIELKPLYTHIENPEDTLMTQMIEQLVTQMGDVPLIFTTDECGAIQHVENWREVRDHARKVSKALTDSLYALRPELAQVIDRQRFEAYLNLQFTNEKSILDSYDELSILFGLHGKAYRIGKSEEDQTTEGGYPKHLELVASYGMTSEDDGFEDDYYVKCLSVITIPAQDVVNMATDRVNMMYNHEMTENDRKELEQTIDEDAKVTVIEDYNYFYNGWPCEMEYDKVTDVKDNRNIEIHRILWTSRTWGVYNFGETQQTGTDI